MVDEQLVSYLKENLAKGYTKEQLKDILSKSGWHPHDLDDAFSSIDKPKEPALPSLPEPPKPRPSPEPVVAIKPAPPPVEVKPKSAEQFYVEPKDKRFNWKDSVIIVGMILALCGVAYTVYIMFLA